MKGTTIFWSAFGATLIVGLAFLFGWAIWSADESAAEKSEQWRKDPTNPINVCIARGGVPITSAWDGRLTECQIVGGSK